MFNERGLSPEEMGLNSSSSVDKDNNDNNQESPEKNEAEHAAALWESIKDIAANLQYPHRETDVPGPNGESLLVEKDKDGGYIRVLDRNRSKWFAFKTDGTFEMSYGNKLSRKEHK
ncbi:MAG: hypothetical protein Q8P20_08410 [bacterium]|nr:hypothetical protein [bacterium]